MPTSQEQIRELTMTNANFGAHSMPRVLHVGTNTTATRDHVAARGDLAVGSKPSQSLGKVEATAGDLLNHVP